MRNPPQGDVNTALNEEWRCQCYSGKTRVSYEAFAMKMIGALRQEITNVRHEKSLGWPARGLFVPVIAMENGKNEQSHQDPAFDEVLLEEMGDTVRVVYPPDGNVAMVCLQECYQTQSQIWAMTVPKATLPGALDRPQALQLVRDGAIALGDGGEVQLIAVGVYQLQVCHEVAEELTQRGLSCGVIYLLEPGRFRDPRDSMEAGHQCVASRRAELFPHDTKLRVFVCHMRPEVLLGACRPLDLGPDRMLAFSYANHGGTLDTAGLLLANQSNSRSITPIIRARLGSSGRELIK